MLTEDLHLLACLAEECDEVGQRCMKALRFGLSEVQPGQPLDNGERITVELNDLFTLVDMCVDRGLIPEPHFSHQKQDQVERFMHYAREQGALV